MRWWDTGGGSGDAARATEAQVAAVRRMLERDPWLASALPAQDALEVQFQGAAAFAAGLDKGRASSVLMALVKARGEVRARAREKDSWGKA